MDRGLEIEIGDRGIRLGQLLKLAGLAASGGSAKQLIDTGQVAVNGSTETRRGVQLNTGDIVTCGAVLVRLT